MTYNVGVRFDNGIQNSVDNPPQQQHSSETRLSEAFITFS